MVEIDVWHVAPARSGGWKVLQQGAAVAESYHDTAEQALEAAKMRAQRQDRSLVKMHDQDNRVVDEIFFGLDTIEA